MLDLSGQYAKIKSEIDRAIQGVIDSSAFIQGKEVAAFAEELAMYMGAKHVIPCGNGTDALQIALMSLGLQVGDEVIVPSFTYIAAAEAVALLGLVPVFVDVEQATCNLDVTQIEPAITPRTKAIIPVHLFGQSVRMEPLLRLARKYNLAVVEDNAQAIGASYLFEDGSTKRCGTMGDFGCLSFFPSKNLACFGDGGALLTNDAMLAERARMIATHGQRVKYRHEILGINSRLDTLQAALLRVKLRYLDEYNAARRQAAAYYRTHLAGLDDYLTLPVERDYSSHVYHQFTVQIKQDKRDRLKAYLHEKGVSSMVYYPLSLPDQEVFSGDQAGCRKKEGCAAVARCLTQSVLSLPMHTELEEEQLAYIVYQLKSFFYAD